MVLSFMDIDEQSPKVPQQPLKKIALSCSGGGYRAASFHLGAMSYLHRLPYGKENLLENVKMISTVSGGTITGVVYALQKQEKKSFEDFYGFMLGKLSKLDLVKMGLDKLNPGGHWTNANKRKNLINAFSELYDEYFTEGSTLKVFETMNSHLEAVAFNSTEFNNAINFRFRNKGTGLNGNNYNQVSQGLAEEIKLADIIAASSCFPGGFEPIMWPGDFAHEGAKVINENIERLKPAGLMDGGIYDNQGIDSILMYKKKSNYFDLIIISDVTSPYMQPFKAAIVNNKAGWKSMTIKQLSRKIKAVNRAVNWILFALVALFALLPLITNYANNWLTGLSIGISFSIFLIWMGKIWAISAIKNLCKNLKSKLEKWINSKNMNFYYERLSKLKIEEIPINSAAPLIIDRLKSVGSLLMDVFLKVVRRLNYKMVYEDEKWQYRRMSNLIRELTEADYKGKEKQPNKPTDGTGQSTTVSVPVSKTMAGSYENVIGPAIKAVAEEASSFGTTLWFTEKEKLADMLGKLIATGQFTMCYNLIEYIETMMYTAGNGYDELDASTKEIISEIHKRCLADWEEFKNDPLFLQKDLAKYVKM